jgi:uncharacterized NAD(P)/FAD-binding protein YdhS
MTAPGVVAVVGAGASGTLTCIHLAAAAGRADRPVDLVLVDDAPVGRGIAYSTPDRRHRLNVPAGRMSVWPDNPTHFVRWLVTHTDPCADAATFAARCDYGRYLHETLLETVAAHGPVHLEFATARVTALSGHGRRLRMSLASGRSRPVDAAVLATGNGAPSTAWAPAELVRSPFFVADPWAESALREIPAGRPVLLVGSGLSMADVAHVLGDGHRILHTVSRHGLLPLAHRDGPVAAVAAPAVAAGPLTWPQLRGLVFDHLRATASRGENWRAGIDALRPVTSALWSRLDEAEQARFLAYGARRWDRARHRLEPGMGLGLVQRRRAGQLVNHTGEVAQCRDLAGGVRVTLTDETVLEVAAVVNCTGPGADVRSDADPLVLNLLLSGAIRPGPHGIGLATDEGGRILSADGHPSRMWTLGPMRRGQLWESTAVPEIRCQAAGLAASIIADLPAAKIRRRPRDVYGLPVSATHEAAQLYDDALARILRVQNGAPARIAAAVATDPDFALGHAALALLGHEWGAPGVDVASSLDAALRGSATADEREQRFIRVVADRIQRPGARSASALIAHIQAYPEDALAVSVAVPTIAFGGATELPQEAWALVEGLAPAYGEDWWYRGLLAFIRQEQQHWDEAMDLATASLATEPASAHAAHARTHVHYETGDHAAGLAWLDGWLTGHGPAVSQRAHFSWHAALHELAVGDAHAAMVRYTAELGPPRVSGVRALVDSVSLLWRGHALGAWEWPSVTHVLDEVPPQLLSDPPTPFIALHAAVALAATEDRAGLSHLKDVASAHVHPAFTTTIAGLTDALIALVDGNAGLATDQLLALSGVASLGGSAAQREVVEETLLYAAVTARRHDVAINLLRARLERRPSSRDGDQLLSLARFPAQPRHHNARAGRQHRTT